MTPQMKSFLKELSALMTKHETEIDVLEETDPYPGGSSGAKGLQFTQVSQYNAETEQFDREYCEIEHNDLNLVDTDLDRLIKNNA